MNRYFHSAEELCGYLNEKNQIIYVSEAVMTKSKEMMRIVDEMRRCEWEYGLANNDDSRRVANQDYQAARSKLQVIADSLDK